jgi:hypothetical protein
MAIAYSILSMGEGKEMTGTWRLKGSTEPDMAGQRNHDQEPFNKMIIRPTIGDGVQKEAICSPT